MDDKYYFMELYHKYGKAIKKISFELVYTYQIHMDEIEAISIMLNLGFDDRDVMNFLEVKDSLIEIGY